MDLLAWFILVVFYLVCVVPMVGNLCGQDTYKESMKVGLQVHITLILIVGFASSVI